MENKIIFLFAMMFWAIGLKAQTGGPGQPEFMQFQQAGTANLVNPSTGAFSYQIPMFTIGGYAMNLTYQSGIQMQDVSTMVGLGWNLNAGCVVRTLRGLADDYKGDTLIKQYSVKANETYGGKLGVDLEIAGLPSNMGLSVGASLGVFYNNYKGWGLEPGINGSISMQAKANEGVGGSASLGMGVSVNSQSGVDKYLNPSLGLKLGSGNDKLGISLGKTWSVNSNEGLKTSLNVGLSFVRSTQNTTRNGIDHGGKVSERSTDQSSTSLLGLTSSSYLNNSFQPNIDYPFENTSGTYSGTVGFDGFYVDPNIRLTGYFSKQALATTSQSFSAYGSMYEANTMVGNPLMDFNTEKKLPYFIGESKILPIPYKTPDVFNLNAQGLSMTFSVTKNDIGLVGDADGITNSNGNQAGAEVNFGELFKVGANFGTTTSFQQTGKWKPNPTNLLFKPNQDIIGNQLYQQFYFKNHGEVNKFNYAAFSTFGGYDPVKFDLLNETSVKTTLTNGGIVNLTASFNASQPVRQSTINYLTAAEAALIGFDKKINYYDFQNTAHAINRVSNYRLGHHLSEISVVQPDGMKYVFGIPVYNEKQKEVSFNIGAATVDFAKNLVNYTHDVDNTAGNSNGIDHFFEATTTPAYATQFLITAVLSPDYRDLTNDGISDDDLGNYVKFSYYKETDNYNWRTPFEQNMATYNKGLRSDHDDDKGTYVFGTKELWYVRTIESKTEIAEFHYSKRDDGYGVLDENGGLKTTSYLEKLDSVVVYSLPDRQKNGNNATPIKTIHFAYNYSLNNQTGNSIPASGTGTGKLTLKNVDFTYGHSRKGKLTPYTFAYGYLAPNVQINPIFDIRSVNRWGYYQLNGPNYSDYNDNSPLSNIDFPYALQKKAVMDPYAYAWNLTNITIPGGGKLKVDYEANDYAYIQNKTAGQMFMLTGLSDRTTTSSNDNNLYSPAFDVSNPFIPITKDRIYFALTEAITNPNPVEARKELEAKYIQDIKDGYLYYKLYVKLTTIPANYEYVTGYTKIKDYGVAPDQIHGYIDLEPINIDDDNVSQKCNPMLKTAFQYMRINRNSLLFSNTSMGAPGNFSAFMNSLPSVFNQLGSQISAAHMGVNLYCETKGYCQSIDLSKSFIRLYNPVKMKIAGGARVKQVSIDDNWDAMTGNTNVGKSYTTSYTYTTTETSPLDTSKITISSGVADYEPMVGGDEISLKQPIFYSDIKKLAPDNDYYVEEPADEALFPAPQITYGKVTQITNGTNLTVGKTGRVVNEFFTAKDYPVKVSRTAIEEKRDKTQFNAVQVPFVAIDQQHDFATVSQGYAIELNNMSGLAKATWVYNQNGDRISGEVFEYFPDNDHFTVIDHEGNISTNNQMGLSVDYTVAGQRSVDQSVSTTYNANFNGSFFGPFLLPLIMPLYSKMTEEKQFQSIVINKVIRWSGILKSKTVYQQSSSVTTENLAFDEITGEAILTKLPNEFNDTLYSFKYPAWWMYDGMKPAYTNTKLLVNNTNKSIIRNLLKVGDELRDLSTGARLWATNTAIPSFENDISLPSNLAGNDDYQVYNSGAKNMLAPSAGKVVTWNLNPLHNGSKIDFSQFNILNSSAVEYYDDAVMYCDSCESILKRLGKNDFLSGKKGNFKPKQSWFYLDERTPGSLPNGQTNIRVQGLYKNYSDFWRIQPYLPLGWAPAYTNWEWKERVNLTDVDGQTIETEDRIGRKSANLLGYKNTLITAQANNSAYGDAYFDGFEDYYCAYCVFKPTKPGVPSSNNNVMKRVRILSGTLIITDAESHTGKYALSVPEAPLVFTILPPVNCKTPTNKDSTVRLSPNAINARMIVQPGTGRGTPVCNECVGGFSPQTNKKYVFSCWVKVNSPPPVLSCSDASVVISNISTSPITLKSDGPVIEGWQRIMGTFTTAGNTNNLSVSLNKGSAATFFDDIRIFPSDGNMIAYVYDDVNLRLTYSLDENNYFTKNEYNSQGELIRIKKETEKGIVTMKESISSLAKQH